MNWIQLCSYDFVPQLCIPYIHSIYSRHIIVNKQSEFLRNSKTLFPSFCHWFFIMHSHSIVHGVGKQCGPATVSVKRFSQQKKSPRRSGRLSSLLAVCTCCFRTALSPPPAGSRGKPSRGPRSHRSTPCWCAHRSGSTQCLRRAVRA